MDVITMIAVNNKYQAYQAKILSRYIGITLPKVQRRLAYWRQEALACPDIILGQQALASLHDKAFHCQGGAVYAAFPPSDNLLEFIVAYQTICDYLDNLCDRANSTDGEAFAQAHQSLTCALTPGQKPVNYYRGYTQIPDGEYLNKLVQVCQQCLDKVPGYRTVYDEVIQLAELYSHLQVKKHLHKNIREDKLKLWIAEENFGYDGVWWQEMAASTGSTLALFALIRAANQPDCSQSEIEQIKTAYFPWICGLHILLDYFVDRAEDTEGGDLNFTFYYGHEVEMQERINLFVRNSYNHALQIADSGFHLLIINGLLAMYLSDKKINQQNYGKIRSSILGQAPAGARSTYHLCRLVRIFL